MRNESENVIELVETLKSQSYGGQHHFYLLDDNSTDDTYALLEKSIEGDVRFSLIRGSQPPAGWIGKTWALEQLFTASNEQIIISLDADV